METTKNMTKRTSDLGVGALSLCVARPILRDQLPAIQGTSASSTGGVPSIKAGVAEFAGDVRPMRERAYVITTAQKFADGVGSSVTWRPPV